MFSDPRITAESFLTYMLAGYRLSRSVERGVPS